jgi:hypothetical protein
MFLGMQTTNILLLVVGALSVGVQASLPRVAEVLARFFARRRVSLHDIFTNRPRHASNDCPGTASCQG